VRRRHDRWADDSPSRIFGCLVVSAVRGEGWGQSAQGLEGSVGSLMGIMVALLKQMHLQKDTGLYASWYTSVEAPGWKGGIRLWV